MSEVTDTRALVDEIAKGKAAPFIIEGPSGRSFSAIPMQNGQWTMQEIQPLENERTPILPKIIEQSVRLQQTESMVAYLNRFKNPDSVLFANIDTSTILAIIDYHTSTNAPAETAADAGQPQARFTKHTATLKLPHSLEWDTWKAIDGRLMKQIDFANFLEENAADILPLGEMRDSTGAPIEDAPTTMLELVRELQVRGSYGASNAIRNGDYVSIEMQKNDDVSTKRNVSLPNEFGLFIPVYFGENAVSVQALLRRRTDDGALFLGVKLVRPETVRQNEFKRIVNEIEQDVALATHYGTPA